MEKKKELFISLTKRSHGLMIIFPLSALLIFSGAWKKKEFNNPGCQPSILISHLGKSLKPFTGIVKDFPCFKITKKDLEDNFLTKGGGKHKIIFRFTITGMATGNEELGVAAYWAKNQTRHGKDAPSIKLDPEGKNCSTIDNSQKYILGNNYIKIKKLKEYLNRFADYAYVRLSPVINKNNSPTDQLVFEIRACKADGSNADSKKPVILDIDPLQTNPSPPAPPGEN